MLAEAELTITYHMERLGIVMQPEAGLNDEAEGVLNPAGARGRDGHYYFFPRIVAPGNYSRIALTRVLFDDGRPMGVERLGIALEPSESYEVNPDTGGGVEDPRITFIPDIDLYVMAYVAYGPLGPRVALATSEDLFSWKRLGLADFAFEMGTDFNAYLNKDAAFFPAPVRAPDGRLMFCLMHRPVYAIWKDISATNPRPHRLAPPEGILDDRPSIWLSYCSTDALRDAHNCGTSLGFEQHRLLAIPEESWEAFRIGGGTQPIETPQGWLALYHGVERTNVRSGVRYCAGALLLDREDPLQVLHRTRQPILEPLLHAEVDGIVSDVVFPTAIDVHTHGTDVYYGMADARIGVARLTMTAEEA
jgi:predicted GH43/DUF377 family glycosyl hydrolase